MNYGEELAGWYLRLNGFFLLADFVIHKSATVAHSSDADLLALRSSHVFEEIGGQADDWDPYLFGHFGLGRIIGLICEVKTGGFAAEKLFPTDRLRACVGRLGLVPREQIGEVAASLTISSSVETAEGAIIGKLFITDHEHESERYVTRTLEGVQDFLRERVRKYPAEKFRDRMFFPSDLFQNLIFNSELERRRHHTRA